MVFKFNLLNKIISIFFRCLTELSICKSIPQYINIKDINQEINMSLSSRFILVIF